MIENPVFNPAFCVEAVEPDSVFLLSEGSYVLLEGPLYCRLAHLLDGQHSVDAIVDQLDGHATPAEIYYALAQLEEKAYVVEGDGGAVAWPRAAFWHSMGIEAGLAERRLGATTVALVRVGAVEVEPLGGALAAAGVRVDDDGDLTIVVCDDYLREGLDQLNASALAAGRPWLLVKPVGMTLWLGPLFQPGKTACWRCLAYRLSSNRAVEGYVQERGGLKSPVAVARAALPTTIRSAHNLAATEIVKAIAAGDGAPTATALVTLDVATLETQRHAVVRRPQCFACGEGDATSRGSSHSPAPIELRSRRKVRFAGGGYRAIPPEQTLALYEHHVSSIAGAVTVLTRKSVAGAESIHVYVAGHNMAMPSANLRELREVLWSRSGGKGTTDVHARTSALCEALERYSGNFHGDEPRTRASCRQLGASAIHPNQCLLFSDAQYRDRLDWNAAGSSETAVPVPFDDTVMTDWTPVWSLTAGDFKYLPTGYLYYGYPMTPQSSSFGADSNGCAAGNTIEEAVLQGFLELAERDAAALWWYNRIRRPAVDLDSFDEPYIEQLRRDYRRLNRQFWVLDIAADLGIPTFVAVSRPSAGSRKRIDLGFGAHLDPTIGVLRALTELSQCAVLGRQLEAAVELSGDALPSRWPGTASVAEQLYLAPDATVPPRRHEDYQVVWSDDLRDDVLRCKEIVEQKGMEMLVLDQTRADIGLNVVKVIVPGLRHIYPRFAPGRLYDTPVQLGWLPAPSTEDGLNPIPPSQ